MGWYCRRSYWYFYLVLILVALVLVREAVRSQSSKLFVSPVLRQGRKYNKGWSKESTVESRTDRGSKIQQQSNSTLKKSHPTARKMLFKGRPYTTPHTPHVVLPDFQTVAISPTKPSIPFHFPHPNLTKTPQEIFSSPWVAKLHKKLTSLPLQTTKQVSVVFSDSGYTESLLNWLIAAQVRLKPPLRNLIVICLDEDILNLLSVKGIPSILVDRTMILKPGAQFRKVDPKYSYVWIIRMVVYRLINYFGYDVVSYDTDAVLLRNLQPVFDKHQDRDIIGSAGHFPFHLGRAWGFTVCMGVIRFRSSATTELMWELMSSLRVRRDSLDDQVRLNYALRQCGIQWQSMAHAASHLMTKSVLGQCSLPPYHKIRVAVLPQSSVCRKCLGKRKYYVVHPLSKKEGSSKVGMAKEIGSWFLARDWRSVGEGLKGTDWLAALMNKSKSHHKPSESRTMAL